MAQSDHISDSLHGEGQAQAQVVRYLYVIKHPELSVYYTNHEEAITVSNLPTAWRHNDPNVFQPMQITHGEINKSTDYSGQATAIQISTRDTTLRRYFLEAPATTIEIAIIRISSSALESEAPGTIDYTKQCQIAEAGYIEVVGIGSGTILAQIMPSPLDGSKQIPRHYYTMTCGHNLYDVNTCGVGQRHTNHMTQTTITAIDATSRTVTLTAITFFDNLFGGGASRGGSQFRGGYLFHIDSGQRFGIRNATFDTGLGESYLVLGHWMELLEVGDNIEAFIGCNRTTAHCSLFDNLANFGGFPYVPNSNPALNSVAT